MEMDDNYTAECPDCKSQARIITDDRWQQTFMDSPCPICKGPTLREFKPVPNEANKMFMVARYAMRLGVSAEDVAAYVEGHCSHGEHIELTTDLIDEIARRKAYGNTES